MNKASTDKKCLQGCLGDLCFIKLSVLGGETYSVSLTSVSPAGLQIDLPSQVGPAEIPGSSKVELSGFPVAMDDLNNTLGTVVWITDGCCGVRFDSDLEGLHLGMTYSGN